MTKQITVQAAAESDGNYGIKSSDGQWYNISKFADNKQTLQETQRNVEEGDVLELSLNSDNFIEDMKVVDDKGGADNDFVRAVDASNQRKDRGGKADRIQRQVALKTAVEYAKTVDRGLEPEEVVAVADTFNGWLDN